ncbi:hypothetical protein [Paracoccus hibiscisoli]|uniref:Uncharacterized protein n=1 Tax=Paracoccus hibiscisoli TaxID=2023261 RepID=A0A4U0QVK7_9RHOB|nr:hypothetical protein [Paracoccus hibiscisoli]TJZ86177.1 hypothetical protein FA740_04625 [Paracoccus hibiscisoli]
MDDFKIVPTPRGAIVHLPDLSAELFWTENGWMVGQFSQTKTKSRVEVEAQLYEMIQTIERIRGGHGLGESLP